MTFDLSPDETIIVLLRGSPSFFNSFKTTAPLPLPVVEEKEYQSSEAGFSIFQLPVVVILRKTDQLGS